MTKDNQEKPDRVIYTIDSEENKPYNMTTWYRSFGIQDFVEKVEKEHVIVGVVFSDNNIGFILDNKKQS